MGSWDCDCAICAGPLSVRRPLSDRPRTARFCRRHPESRPPNEREGSGDGNDPDEQETDDDDESITSEDEESSFDPEILTEEDYQWMNTMHTLTVRRNPTATNRIDRAFTGIGAVSGPGEYMDSGRINVRIGDDPNFDPEGDNQCYDGAYPFHWPCYRLLRKAFGCDGDFNMAEKHRLFWTMCRASSMCAYRLDELDHTDICFPSEQWWSAVPGLEFLVTNPMDSTGLVDLVRQTIQTIPRPPSRIDLSQRVKNDPFQRLPAELVENICSFIPADSIFPFVTASWVVNDTLRNNAFWKRQMGICMPWFFELLQLLDPSGPEGDARAEELDLKNRDHKKLFLLVDRVTKPRPFMRGPWMRLANRRRIWYLCKQLYDRFKSVRLPID
ncbi:hypothetical protein PT974_12366 [Cladobotryum mycophilum]|uniref:F-box domain-containing protein n=1 Tax=Cladobotryum mycophilum TaxID=491253 RepID=A0ABR0S7T5_9HYPO